MAVHKIGTNASNSMNCVVFGTGNAVTISGQTLSGLTDADCSFIDQLIVSDGELKNTSVIGAATWVTTGNGVTAFVASQFTLAAIAASPTPIWVFGAGIPPGTSIVPGSVNVAAGTFTLTATPTANGTGATIYLVPAKRFGSFNKTGRLEFPRGRGWIQLQPGDIVATDAAGFPFPIPAESVNVTGSSWTFL